MDENRCIVGGCGAQARMGSAKCDYHEQSESRVCHLCFPDIKPAKPGVIYTCMKCRRSFEGDQLLAEVKGFEPNE